MFANEREWSLHNSVLHFKPATSFAGSKRKSNDDDNKSGSDVDDSSGGDSNSSQKRKKWILEKVENAGPDMTAFLDGAAANRVQPTAEHTSAGPPPTDDDDAQKNHHGEQPQTPDGQRQSTSSPNLSLCLSQSPLSQPGAELAETGEIGELSAAGLSQADLEESEMAELRMEQERMDREMAERMQTEETERARDLESDRKFANALQERESEDADESDPGEGPSGGRNRAASLNVQKYSERVEAAETPTAVPNISSNDEMNGEVNICGTKDVDMADAQAGYNAQETGTDLELGTSMDHETSPEGEGPPEPEQGSSKNRGSGTNSDLQQDQAKKCDKKSKSSQNSSMLPRKLFVCNQCDPPLYFIVEKLESESLVEHMMATNHTIGVDEIPPLSVLKEFSFSDHEI